MIAIDVLTFALGVNMLIISAESVSNFVTIFCNIEILPQTGVCRNVLNSLLCLLKILLFLAFLLVRKRDTLLTSKIELAFPIALNHILKTHLQEGVFLNVQSTKEPLQIQFSANVSPLATIILSEQTLLRPYFMQINQQADVLSSAPSILKNFMELIKQILAKKLVLKTL